MKIAVVADKKAGHLSQCLGLREIIKTYNKEKDVFILGKDLFFFQVLLKGQLLYFRETLFIYNEVAESKCCGF